MHLNQFTSSWADLVSIPDTIPEGWEDGTAPKPIWQQHYEAWLRLEDIQPEVRALIASTPGVHSFAQVASLMNGTILPTEVISWTHFTWARYLHSPECVEINLEDPNRWMR